jgi:hypothetical protein
VPAAPEGTVKLIERFDRFRDAEFPFSTPAPARRAAGVKSPSFKLHLAALKIAEPRRALHLDF